MQTTTDHPPSTRQRGYLTGLYRRKLASLEATELPTVPERIELAILREIYPDPVAVDSAGWATYLIDSLRRSGGIVAYANGERHREEYLDILRGIALKDS